MAIDLRIRPDATIFMVCTTSSLHVSLMGVFCGLYIKLNHDENITAKNGGAVDTRNSFVGWLSKGWKRVIVRHCVGGGGRRRGEVRYRNKVLGERQRRIREEERIEGEEREGEGKEERSKERRREGR
jgi:hypothetical protein